MHDRLLCGVCFGEVGGVSFQGLLLHAAVVEIAQHILQFAQVSGHWGHC